MKFKSARSNCNAIPFKEQNLSSSTIEHRNWCYFYSFGKTLGLVAVFILILYFSLLGNFGYFLDSMYSEKQKHVLQEKIIVLTVYSFICNSFKYIAGKVLLKSLVKINSHKKFHLYAAILFFDFGGYFAGCLNCNFIEYAATSTFFFVVKNIFLFKNFSHYLKKKLILLLLYRMNKI